MGKCMKICIKDDNEEALVFGNLHMNKTLQAGKQNVIDILQKHDIFDEKKHLPVNLSES